jgi:hypothetical protein
MLQFTTDSIKSSLQFSCNFDVSYASEGSLFQAIYTSQLQVSSALWTSYKIARTSLQCCFMITESDAFKS